MVAAGGYHVIDGQHTAIAAATHNAMSKKPFHSGTVGTIGNIPVMVLEADSVERARTPIASPVDFSEMV